MSTEVLWNKLLEEVNPRDTEDSDFDSVRMMLENEVSESSIIDLSIQYGGGNLTEGRDIHINLIMCAIYNFIRESRENTLQGKCLIQLVEEEEEKVLLECPICYDEIDHLRTAILGCQHEFCRPCLEKHIEINKMKCPMCRGEIQNITVRHTEDYTAICELAARTNLPSVVPDDEFIYREFEYGEN
jgi:hypothetical protein